MTRLERVLEGESSMTDVKVNGWVLVPRIDAELTPEERARVEKLLQMISEVERGERK